LWGKSGQSGRGGSSSSLTGDLCLLEFAESSIDTLRLSIVHSIRKPESLTWHRLSWTSDLPLKVGRDREIRVFTIMVGSGAAVVRASNLLTLIRGLWVFGLDRERRRPKGIGGWWSFLEGSGSDHRVTRRIQQLSRLQEMFHERSRQRQRTQCQPRSNYSQLPM